MPNSGLANGESNLQVCVAPGLALQASLTGPNPSSSVYSLCPFSGIMFVCREAQTAEKCRLGIYVHILMHLQPAPRHKMSLAVRAGHVQWFSARVEK